MSRVRVEGRALVADGRRVPLLSGEIHYWRLAPENWDACLDAAKGLGLDLLALYVPWTFHRLASGGYDFRGEGDPRRNLEGFLDRASAKGFRLFVRPGPWVYAEWPNAGCPDEVVHLHRLHPKLLALAADWIRAVSTVLVPRLATRGGPIVLVQADNEIDPFPTWHGRSLGLEGGPGLEGEPETPFARFLRERYGEVGALNDAWGTGLRAFDEACAWAADPASDPAGLDAFARRRREDWRDFVHDFVNRAARWTVAELRSRGIDVPIALNAYPDCEVQDLRALSSIADLVGHDLYPSEGFARGTDEHRRFLERIRMTRVATPAPWIAEFSAGVWHGQHRVAGVPAALHYFHAGASALVGGACGWNWYMLVGRDNWYGSPINEWGRPRPELHAAFGELVRLYRALDPPTMRKVVGLGVSWGVSWHRDPRFGEADPVLRALHEAGLDYEFFDVETGRWPDGAARLGASGAIEEGPPRLLLYSGPAALAPGAAARLASFVEEGGTLAIFRGGLGDPAGEARLPGGPPDLVTFGWGVRFEVALGSSRFLADGPVNGWRSVRGEAVVGRRVPRGDHDLGELARLDAVPAGSESIVGEVRAVGRGRVVRLGIDATPEAILAVAAWAGARIPARARPRGAQAAVLDGPAGRFLLVVHDGRTPPLAEVVLDPAVVGEGRAERLLTGRPVEFARGESSALAVGLERGYAAIQIAAPR